MKKKFNSVVVALLIVAMLISVIPSSTSAATLPFPEEEIEDSVDCVVNGTKRTIYSLYNGDTYYQIDDNTPFLVHKNVNSSGMDLTSGSVWILNFPNFIVWNYDLSGGKLDFHIVDNDTTAPCFDDLGYINGYQKVSGEICPLLTFDEISSLYADSTPLPAITNEPSLAPSVTSKPSSTPLVTSEPSKAPTITSKPSSAPLVTSDPSLVPTITSEPSSAPLVTNEPSKVPTITSEPSSAPLITNEPSKAPSNTNKPSNTKKPADKKIAKNKLRVKKKALYNGNKKISHYSIKKRILTYKRTGKKTKRYKDAKSAWYIEKSKNLLYVTKKRAALYIISYKTGKRKCILSGGVKKVIAKNSFAEIVKRAKKKKSLDVRNM